MDTQSINKSRIWTQTAIIVLAVVVFGGPTLMYPFGRDQGEYAWIAASALQGKVIYTDVFNVKPPLTHVIHEAAILLFGHHMVSIRILDMLWQGATAILIFKIAKNIGENSFAPMLAAILYLIMYYTTAFWTTAQTDGFINLPVTAGILLFLYAEERNRIWLYAVSGVAIGLATLLKYPIGILLPFMAVLVLFKLRKNGVIPTLLMGFGTLLPLGCSAIFMFISGNLDAFLRTQFAYISNYSTMPWQELSYIGSVGSVFLLQLASPGVGWISLCGWLGLITGPARARTIPKIVIALWWISAAIHFIIQNKFYTYHILPLYAPLALMLVQFFIDEPKTLNRVQITLGFLGIFLVVFPFFLSDFQQKYIRTWRVLTGSDSLQTVYLSDAFGAYNKNTDFSSRADIEVADYIAGQTQPSEKIFIWGFEPEIYFLSQRENATRFIYNFPLYGPHARVDLQQEFISDLGMQKPVYMLIVKNDAIPHVTATSEDSWAAYKSFTDFHDFVSIHYHFETAIEDFVIYRLNQ